MFSSLNLHLQRRNSKMVEPPKCEDCKHFVRHVGPVMFSSSNPIAQDLGRCKLLGYDAFTCRTHWLSSISCGHEARFFNPNRHCEYLIF